MSEPQRVVVYGGGGHGLTLIDTLRVLPEYDPVAVIDDGRPAGDDVLGVPVVGGGDALDRVVADGITLAVNAVGAVRDLAVRAEVFDRLERAGLTCPAVIHPTAWVDLSATVEDGAHVLAHAYVGSDTTIGFGAVLNTGAVVSHGCTLGRFANMSPGALIAGDVVIGERALVGMGVTVNFLLSIGDRARIGNSAVVKADVPADGVVSAGQIWSG